MSPHTLRRSLRNGLLLLAALSFPLALQGQAAALPSIAEKTAGTQAITGFFNLYWDNGTGTLFWEIDRLDTEFLYQISMGAGLGSIRALDHDFFSLASRKISPGNELPRIQIEMPDVDDEGG